MNIGFVSTRFAGTDGVSLETRKWEQVLGERGHTCFWFAGQADRPPERTQVVPQAFFQHPENRWIDDRVFGCRRRDPEVTRAIHRLRRQLKTALWRFVRGFEIQLLVVENALAIPMHIPLGLAITELVAETGLPAIAHHHDFHWERTRFAVNAVEDYLRMSFPPALPAIEHVVLGQSAARDLAHRCGLGATIVPNVLDFENPPVFEGQRAAAVRRQLGIGPDDIVLLQPTRVVQRKGIEWAVELAASLERKNVRLLVSHEAGDEGFEYARWLVQTAGDRGVDLRMIPTPPADPWKGDGRTSTDLWDVYSIADFVTFPSSYEGFGNAFLEAVYFRRPLLVNRYATYVTDIEPLGFEAVVMDGYLTREAVGSVETLLDSPVLRRRMVERNYRLAARNFSYGVLRSRLAGIMGRLAADTGLAGAPAETPVPQVLRLDRARTLNRLAV